MFYNVFVPDYCQMYVSDCCQRTPVKSGLYQADIWLYVSDCCQRTTISWLLHAVVMCVCLRLQSKLTQYVKVLLKCWYVCVFQTAVKGQQQSLTLYQANAFQWLQWKLCRNRSVVWVWMFQTAVRTVTSCHKCFWSVCVCVCKCMRTCVCFRLLSKNSSEV